MIKPHVVTVTCKLTCEGVVRTPQGPRELLIAATLETIRKIRDWYEKGGQHYSSILGVDIDGNLVVVVELNLPDKDNDDELSKDLAMGIAKSALDVVGVQIEEMRAKIY